MSDNRRTDNAQVHDGETGETGYPRRVILDGSLAAERRATGIAERYWRAVGGEAGVPSLNDIDMEQTSSIWSDRFLIRRDHDIAQSVFIVCGLRARRAIGLPALGRCLGEVLPSSIAEEIYQACDMATRDARPEHLQGVFTSQDGRRLLFRGVFMPLRALSNDLGYIFGAFSARRQSA